MSEESSIFDLGLMAISAPQSMADWPTTTTCRYGSHEFVFLFFKNTRTTLGMALIDSTSLDTSPPTWRWVVGFLLVGMAWGLTTPFMRKGALSKDQKPPAKRPVLTDPKVSWLRRKILGVVYAVVDLLKNPAYAVPLLLNVTGSVWFFLLIGQAG